VTALERALVRGTPEVFNTDQGSQFTSEAFTGILLGNQIAISMDGRGRALDNVFIERLWWTVKYEDVYPKAYADGHSLYRGLARYFEYYNNERKHSALDKKTPAEVFLSGEINNDDDRCRRSAPPSALWAAPSGTGCAPRRQREPVALLAAKTRKRKAQILP